ncbi:MAG TPA: 4Fe-4S binding protein [Candidatus Marinimicrobia bacterium]|nr:4Fe-4S binding protein [Candidatus Neomarinimicrobiota bacterium]HQE95570.1 4Fe-4S binding protein [Candidatus Neomarinimicrobiota bacterium]HQH56348.1 4Fe-4S binding protein [Candidatus Neomarinimicrobiota bacterium]HQK11800.1 4Fe-4S binding protein [Candidatus Neomarinimicrobiota bacterium]
MFLPKLRELNEALRSLFSLPFTTKFPAKPHQPADGFRGFPEYHQEFCVGCGTCAQVCPTSAISVTDDIAAHKRILRVDYTSCAQCGQCQEKCITGKGIQLSKNYLLAISDLKDQAVYNTVEKDLALCEACGTKIACFDQLLFVKERLGAKSYANPNLLLVTQQQFSEIPDSHVKDRLRREDYVKMVCPKCRHKIVVKDEF